MADKSAFRPLAWQVDAWRDTSPVMVCVGGAGSGKTRLAAEKVHAYCLRYPGAVGIVGRFAREFARKSVVPAMLSVIGNTHAAQWSPGNLSFDYVNGSKLYLFGVKDENQRQALRSIGADGAVDIAWIEEANAISYDAFQEIQARMRGQAGGFRQVILTLNPDGPTHWIKRRLIDGGMASVHTSLVYDNMCNLPDSYLDQLNTLTGARRARLLEGAWSGNEGALWQHAMIDDYRVSASDLTDIVRDAQRIVVGVDPAVTNNAASDHTGIVTVALRDGHYYVVADDTTKGTPNAWASRAVAAARRFEASAIVAEVNNGGDLVPGVIGTVDPTVRVVSVRATRGKALRAEPVVSLYEKGRVHHVGYHPQLEAQMISWSPPDGESPDRLDALVWAVTELAAGKTQFLIMEV